ncbi:MAG: Mov34/MPN/PAD-1 family protein, partial [Paludibacteraceae bacterium]|nr:Mov34/MPN/PAD-1 family protein [Paludibacteraceae bacterium]
MPAQLEPSEVAIIYRSELEFVSRCILDYPNIETGGQMFGYWTDDGTPVVLYTIGPGPRANHERSFFNQDVAYLESVGNMLIQKYGLQHIGEWHSHHKLGLAHPSGHDAASMAH